jgi:hypothetical protein
MTTCGCRIEYRENGDPYILKCPMCESNNDLLARAAAVEKAARKVVAVKEDSLKAIFKSIDDLESALALCEEKEKEKA